MGTMKTLIAGILSVIQPSGKNQILHIQSKSTVTVKTYRQNGKRRHHSLGEAIGFSGSSHPSIANTGNFIYKVCAPC